MSKIIDWEKEYQILLKERDEIRKVSHQRKNDLESRDNGFIANLKKDAGVIDADHIKTVTDKLLITNSGIKCKDITTGKLVTAYHVDEAGAAHNKSNTKCIGCIGVDLIPI